MTMDNLQKKFKSNEWQLICHILQWGKKDTSWVELAVLHNIKPNGSIDQKRKRANDVWRRFNRLLKSSNFDLETVKQTFNRQGDVLFETKKRTPIDKDLDVSNMVVDKITTNPHGGEWVTYKNKNETSEGILEGVEKLINKHIGLLPSEVQPLIKKEIEEEWFGDPAENKLAVVNLYDAHLDKLPIKSTCGVESTLEENCDIFLNTIDRICKDLKSNNVGEIILPVGNDLFHTNGFNSQTKKGTQIEYYGSPEDNYYKICDTITIAIKKVAEIALNKVKVIMVKGNHDEDKITVLGYWLERIFAGSNVEVDYLRKQRKYIKFGDNLLGFAHGDKEKSKIAQLPLIMATEAKELWGQTTYRKMYLGDLHHGFEYQFLKAKDQPGVEVEYLRSVGTTDTWHEDFGWIGVPKTAYLQIFDKNEGEELRKKYNIK